MKLRRVGSQVVIPIILISSLSSCTQAPSQTSASQPQSSSDQAQTLRQTIGQTVNGVAKLRQELAIQANPSNATAAPANGSQLNLNDSMAKLLNPENAKKFKELARLYETQNAPPNQAKVSQEDPKAFQNFLADQGQSTLAFAYQMRGDYQRAFEVMTNRIAALEASNQDGSKSHRLAECYAQCADYLNHLGRSGEAQQMVAKARAIEPNHY